MGGQQLRGEHCPTVTVCVCASRWPRTLAGITAFQSCLQYPFASGPASGGPAAEKQASRRCDRAGRWEEGDYSHCLYTNDITRVLYTFVLVSQVFSPHGLLRLGSGTAVIVPCGCATLQMPINASNALTLAHQLRVYTAEAANFSDMVDVLYVAQMIEKFIGYVDQIKQVMLLFFAFPIRAWWVLGGKHELGMNELSATCSRLSSQLTDVIVEMASNIMLVDDHILWMSQKEEKACTSIVRSLEKIAAHTLSTNSQHMAVVSPCMQRGSIHAHVRGLCPCWADSRLTALCLAELTQHRLRGVRGKA